MTTAPRNRFSSRLTPETLAALRRISARESRPLQDLLEEALVDFIERKEGGRARDHVMAGFAASLTQFDELYRSLPR